MALNAIYRERRVREMFKFGQKVIVDGVECLVTSETQTTVTVISEVDYSEFPDSEGTFGSSSQTVKKSLFVVDMYRSKPKFVPPTPREMARMGISPPSPISGEERTRSHLAT